MVHSDRTFAVHEKAARTEATKNKCLTEAREMSVFFLVIKMAQLVKHIKTF